LFKLYPGERVRRGDTHEITKGTQVPSLTPLMGLFAERLTVIRYAAAWSFITLLAKDKEFHRNVTSRVSVIAALSELNSFHTTN